MSKYCPVLKRKVVYLDCLECEDKQCEKKSESVSAGSSSETKQTDCSPDNSGK